MAQQNEKRQERIRIILLILILILANVFSANWFRRIDLTEDGRYTVSNAAVEVVQALDRPATVTVYFTGDMPTYYKRLEEGIVNYLSELTNYANGNLKVNFLDPTGQYEIFKRFKENGMDAFPLPTQGNVSELREQLVLPYAEISYKERVSYVNLIAGSVARRRDGQFDIDVEKAISKVEYNIVNELYNRVRGRTATIGLLQGHGEYNFNQMADLSAYLDPYYNLVLADIRKGRPIFPEELDVLMILQPESAISEREKYEIDQYLMRGGKVIVVMDQEKLDFTVGEMGSTLTELRQTNFDDFLMRHGIKINYDLVQDLNCGVIDLSQYSETFGTNNNVKRWPFSPVVFDLPDHPVTRYLYNIEFNYASTIDTFITPGLRKSVLATTSPSSRVLENKQFINIDQLATQPLDERKFRGGKEILAIVAEGEFRSLFEGRRIPVDTLVPFPPQAQKLDFSRNDSLRPMLAVISDGEFAKGITRGDKIGPLRADNRTFMTNLIDVMTGQDLVTHLRVRDVIIRRLNPREVRDSVTSIRLINIGLPVLLIALFGIFRAMRRRWRNAKYRTTDYS